MPHRTGRIGLVDRFFLFHPHPHPHLSIQSGIHSPCSPFPLRCLYLPPFLAQTPCIVTTSLSLYLSISLSLYPLLCTCCVLDLLCSALSRFVQTLRGNPIGSVLCAYIHCLVRLSDSVRICERERAWEANQKREREREGLTSLRHHVNTHEKTKRQKKQDGFRTRALVGQSRA